MSILGPLAVLFVSLTLSACADFDTGEDHLNGQSPADAYIGNTKPGAENNSKFNHGIGATP